MIRILLTLIDLLLRRDKNISMRMKAKEASVVFSTRGQIVIPRQIRKDFGIEEGTRALVSETQEGILLKPVTGKTIRALYGKYRHLPLMETLAAMKHEERER